MDERELRRAAADVDVQHRRIGIFRVGHRSGTVRAQYRFELMTRRRTDEFSGVRCEQLVDRFGVALLDRLTGEDHRATVDRFGRRAGVVITRFDETAEFVGVDRARLRKTA